MALQKVGFGFVLFPKMQSTSLGARLAPLHLDPLLEEGYLCFPSTTYQVSRARLGYG